MGVGGGVIFGPFWGTIETLPRSPLDVWTNMFLGPFALADCNDPKSSSTKVPYFFKVVSIKKKMYNK